MQLELLNFNFFKVTLSALCMYSHNMFLSNLTCTFLEKMVTDNFVCGDDHALTPVKAKLSKNVELTLLRKLFPFPEYYEDILVHHPTNHLHQYLKDKTNKLLTK